jgi:PAS domain S-box-containing protein
MGIDTELYSALDEQIQELSQRQDLVVLSNPTRAGLQLNPGISPPGALVAVAIRHDEDYYGALWVAHKKDHKFTKEATRFIKSLAGQAELAIVNARLYLNANIGRQRLEAILSSTSDPLLVTDFNDRLLLANPAAMELLGTDTQPKAGMPINEVVSQKDLLELIVSSENEPASAEIVFPKNRVYYASVSPVAADGQPMGRVSVLRDITYLKELDTLKTDFVNTVSLDLRSPLKLMRGHTTMVETVGDLNAQQAGYMRKIVDGIESMSALVNNLLDLGRIEAGVGLHLEKVQIIEVAAQVLEALRGRANQKNITLSLDGSKSALPLVEADKALLQQALRNLLENAIKFTNRDGEIHVRITPHQDAIVLSVVDNGIGVAPIDQPRLFERFFRVEQLGEETQEQSSGLGLAIVKSIAEQHGGKIWMESQLGEGSAFHFRIPYRQLEL